MELVEYLSGNVITSRSLMEALKILPRIGVVSTSVIVTNENPPVLTYHGEIYRSLRSQNIIVRPDDVDGIKRLISDLFDPYLERPLTLDLSLINVTPTIHTPHEIASGVKPEYMLMMLLIPKIEFFERTYY